MSSTGTDGLAWMVSRYWSVDFRMSLVRRAFSESAGGADCCGVRGAWIRRTPGGRSARLAMFCCTVLLASTVPSKTVRFLSPSTLYVSWRRSSSVDVGVSTTTCVDAVAISSEREVSDGGKKLISLMLQTATI